jgi:hypothetical protein
MRNRSRTASLVAAMALVALPALAGADEIVKSGIPWLATGKVVAKSADKIVLRTDDHKHKVAFAVDRSTVLPSGLKVGQHVSIVYHPIGSTGQTADTVTETPAKMASR